MTRQEFEKAIQAGVKNFRVVKDSIIDFPISAEITLVCDDGSSMLRFTNGSKERWLQLTTLEPIYPIPILAFKVGDRVRHAKFGGGMVIYANTHGSITVLFDNPSLRLHGGNRELADDCQRRCWFFDGETIQELQFISEEPTQEDTFKVGDRVETPKSGIGTVIQISREYYTILHDTARSHLHEATYYTGEIPESTRRNRCWIYLKEDLKHSSVPAPKPSQELFFGVCYDKICVKLVVDGEVQAYAEAKVACPEDDFHLLTGAQIALQRLAEKTGSKIVVPKSALSDRVELI